MKLDWPYFNVKFFDCDSEQLRSVNSSYFDSVRFQSASYLPVYALAYEPQFEADHRILY